MAERNETAQPVGTAKVTKHVVNPNVISSRNVEVKAVGAWVEPATFYSVVRIPDAVVHAQETEEKIEAMQREKEERLRQFREDVRKRVRHVCKLKRKQQVERDFKQLQKQHQFVGQTLQSSEHLLDHKNRVMQKASSQVSVNSQQQTGHSNIMGDSSAQRRIFKEHNEQVHTVNTQARQKLISRRIADDQDDSVQLPGGRWQGTVPGRHRARTAWTENEEEDEVEKEEREKFHEDEREGERKKDSDDEAIQDVMCERVGIGEQEDDDFEENVGDEGDGRRSVRFDLDRPQDRPSTGKEMRKKASRAKRSTSAPLVRGGVQENEEKFRRGQQMLNCRRLFSELERRTARDNARRKKQQLRINKIRKEKELAREMAEHQAQQLAEPRDPMTGETIQEWSLREQMERLQLQEAMREKEEQRQRQREMARYLEALRTDLREKVKRKHGYVAALCSCGETIWDTHPDTCANNCFFYKNYRAYARALQSLLNSSDVL